VLRLGGATACARRCALTLWLAGACGLVLTTDAPALTLQLVFPDGQPMTYGSACTGAGCLARGTNIAATDASGTVALADSADRRVEYRRDGIDLAQAPPGTVTGVVGDVGAGTTVTLPWMLAGSDAAVDAGESELVAGMNAERLANGLAPAVLSPRLSTAADLQATWLGGSGLGLPLPLLSHLGPYASTLAFRLAEVSFPEPSSGSEIEAAGLTPAQAVATWVASAPHRAVLLAQAPPLIGVARVGNVIVVDAHPACRGCQPSPPTGATAGGTAGALVPAGVAPSPAQATTTSRRPGASPLTGSSSSSSSSGTSSCRAERLTTRRLRTLHGRLRLRVSVACLRSGATYTLSVLQRPSRSILRTRRIKAAGAIILSLRPSRTTRSLGIKLKRNGRAVAARTISPLPARR
jgi:uncharacterized protein YkwD